MCELLAVVGDGPFSVELVLPLIGRLERFGIAGFGWGAAWLEAGGAIATHRSGRAFRDDAAGRTSVGAALTTSLLVHLRRPSRLSTLTLADTQPFLDPSGRFALAHNGDLRDVATARERYRSENRIHGRADSEVGARWIEDEWGHDEAPALLRRLHERFGGQANLGLLEPGAVHLYAGNTENPVFSFRLGELRCAATGIYSLDRSFFRYVAPAASSRRLVRTGRVETLVPPGLCDAPEGGTYPATSG